MRAVLDAARLDPDSLRQFTAAVASNRESIFEYWEKQQKALLAARLPSAYAAFASDTDSDWPLLNGNPDPTYMISELNNPHAYCFDFDFSCGRLDRPLPLCDYPSVFYIQLAMYSQVCKDYRWPAVERTIAWVRASRADVRSPRLKDRVRPSMSQENTSPIPTQTLFQQDAVFRAQLMVVMHKASVPFISDEDEDDSGSGSTVWSWWLPFAFPYLAGLFGKVPLPRTPQVVVLDTFGVILDREGAIRNALEPWLPLVRHPLWDIVEAVKLYVEVEALAARELRACATSLPTIVHTALATLSTKFGLPLVFHPAFLAGAATPILRPRPYGDTERAVAHLVERGCTVVGLMPFSASTFDALSLALLPCLHAAVQLCPYPIPLHVTVPDAFFARLRQWFQEVLPACPNDYAPAEVVVASGDVGRVLVSSAADEHPTVLIKRPGSIECDVDFVVGRGNRTPRPSAVVDGLDGLCRALSL